MYVAVDQGGLNSTLSIPFKCVTKVRYATADQCEVSVKLIRVIFFHNTTSPHQLYLWFYLYLIAYNLYIFYTFH